ncbi:hypothetical protein [Sphingobacterium siyangense]|jgi:hypothetical protein|uniref:hypothetical protein n=1 Tax=Sphingobacterium siyangense TaxID=459529 RepID=UPI0028AD3048|nr:hypothetical protein [Sphingobacterium siyangense]
MKRLSTFVLNKIILEKDNLNLIDLVTEINQKQYDEENGFGVLSYEKRGENNFMFEIVKRSPTYLLEFDRESKEMTKQLTYLFKQSSFEIDQSNMNLTVYGGLSNASDIKLFFRRYFSDVKLIPIQIDIKSFFYRTSKTSTKTAIKFISIKNFIYNNGIVGKFSGEIIDTTIVNEILENYSKDILRATFNIEIEDSVFDVQIFPVGSLKLMINSGNTEMILNYLYNNIE